MQNLLKKSLAVGVILLFIGLAFIPSINANISLDNRLVEITTEICGIDGIEPNTVRLTKQESKEVEQLIDSIKAKLDKAKTRGDTVEIFNDAIIEFDKYGLLGGLSVEKIQRLIIKPYMNSRMFNIINNLNLDDDLSCLMVLIFAQVNGGFVVNPSWILFILLFLVGPCIPHIFDFIWDSTKVRRFIENVLTWYFWLKPFRAMHILYFDTIFGGYCEYFHSIGIGGINEGTNELESIVGFKGLTLVVDPLNNPEKVYYIGFANAIDFY